MLAPKYVSINSSNSTSAALSGSKYCLASANNLTADVAALLNALARIFLTSHSGSPGSGEKNISMDKR